MVKKARFAAGAAASDSAAVMGNAMAGAMQSVAGLKLPAEALNRIQADYLQEAARIWQSAAGFARAAPNHPEAAAPPLPDRRFAAKEWSTNPLAHFAASMYLLNGRALTQMAQSMQGDAKTQARVRFAVQQWVEALSPANFFALNPEAQKKAIETGGRSLARGMENLLHDIRQGHLSQTDEAAFEVGRNVASTAGAVVFENELFQLIEYQPLTAKVYERPMLFVPPCINKYYILDLQPENSFIRYTVEQGHRTFVMSWRNPDQSMVDTTWDDYVAQGPIEAIRVVQEITGAKTIDTLGFCIGGTLLATALGVLAGRGEQPAQSMTLLTSFVDFSDTGVMDIFIDEAAVRMREMTLGPDAPNGPGLLKGKELASTFNFLRPNDLVWNYVVGNYLKGEAPPAFDLLYWNGDATNMPGPMYCWYLRNTYLENNLKVPGKVTVCGEKLDLGRIKAPVFIYASREDHIVPWRGAYGSTQIFTGPKRYVLGASGHVAGVINPPAAGKRSHWVNDSLPPSADDWLAAATEKPGSWWTNWAAWLKGHAGKQVAAPKAPGSAKYQVIEPAPGRYVKQKA